ncbi:unnamed protein product [Caenorhabditis bovis]|uniref:Uncharacterized protein n=1 Tax=Caenorhabditis bovis TaxID=2654633 RepID=A0A8S1ETX7_9PELO|nr:unnamed protein product [Caenorhabditis bovis]
MKACLKQYRVFPEAVRSSPKRQPFFHIKADDAQFLRRVVEYAVGGLGCGLIVLVVAIIQGLLIQRATQNIVDKLRREYVASILRQSADWLDRHPSGALISQLNESVKSISDGLGNKMCVIVRGVSMFLTSILICSFINLPLTFVTMTIGPISAFILRMLTKINESTTAELVDETARFDAILDESIRNVRTVQACNGQRFIGARLKLVNERAKLLANKIGFWSGFLDGLSLFVVFLITGLALFFGIRLFFDGVIKTAGDVILIVNTICVTGYFLGLLGPHLSTLQHATIAFNDLQLVISSSNRQSNNAKEEISMNSSKGHHITFENVHFKYSTRDKQILKGLSFEASPGETIALFGASGSGKSTTIGLLTKMYRADRGEIRIDGINIDNVDEHVLRTHFGIVQQEPKLFEGTIMENIKLGREISDEEAMKAARIANADEFIRKLRNGYETKLGTGGVQLSGGQKQRICISRALATSPSVLLLDEATSALDSHSESVVNAALQNASIGRTTIVIAHRLSSLKNADRIYVIDNGKIIEIGSHDELMSNNGMYARLAKAQDIEQSDRWNSDDAIAADRMNSIERHEPTSSNEDVVRVDENSDRISMSGYWKFLKHLQHHRCHVLVMLLLSIPRAAEICFYGLGLSLAFNALDANKDSYVPWAWLTLGEQILAGSIVWIMHTVLTVLCNRVANDVMSDIKENLLARLLHRPQSYFDVESTSPSACIATLAGNLSNASACIDHRALRFLWFALSTLISLAMAFPFVWEIGLIGLAINVLLTMSTFILFGLAHKSHAQKSSNDRSREFAVEIIEQVRSIKLMAVESYFETRFAHYQGRSKIYENRLGLISSIHFALTQSYVFVCDMLLYLVGALLIYHGRYESSRIFLAFNGAQMSAWSVMYFAPYIPEVVRASAAANRIWSIYENRVDDRMATTTTTPMIDDDVKLDNVSFAYAASPNKKVLNGLTLDVAKGKSIALVGPSGSGKSTIVSLLERFYDPTDGRIMIGSSRIDDIDISHLRSNIALVSQEPVLFNVSIYENITMGVDGATMEDVKLACKIANASQFIENFPSGYDTIVGEGGGSLSGGQKQRIAIARAIVRKPKILLLDEANSALDAESDRIVQNALRSASQGRTSITIAHRLSTVQNCDMIYYICDGRITESGTHSDLLKLNGKYAKLVAAQC